MLDRFLSLLKSKGKQQSLGLDNSRNLPSGKRALTFPSLKQFRYAFSVLSTWEQNTVKGLLGVIILAFGFLGYDYYVSNTEQVPDYGGTYIEAVVGVPEYINPVLAYANDIDMDLTRLMFSGLLKRENGKLLLDAAENYEISEDQKTYTFSIRQDVYFHDGEQLTSNDVLFTIAAIQDPKFKSPFYATFANVSVNVIDDFTIEISLDEPFAPFLDVLTVGILPSHIWERIPPTNAILTDFNLRPIGSGPYEFQSLTKDKLGNLKSYTVVANEQYYEEGPYVSKIQFKLYPDYASALNALQNKLVNGLSYVSKEYKQEVEKRDDVSTHTLQLPQYTAIFFNPKENTHLKNKKVREALAHALNRQELIDEGLHGEAKVINAPILEGYIGHKSEVPVYPTDLLQAQQLLKDAGYTLTRFEAEETQETSDEQTTEETTDETADDETSEETKEEQTEEDADGVAAAFWSKGSEALQVKLSTIDTFETRTAAEKIAEQWQALGVLVELEVVPPLLFAGSVLQNRSYDALVYGHIIGSDPDPLPFWHSSQIDDPGLNLSLFANRHVDKLLEEARQTHNPEERQEKYEEFQNRLLQDVPALFLFSPTYTYVMDADMKGFDLKRISIPADRFSSVHTWYLKTKNVFNQ